MRVRVRVCARTQVRIASACMSVCVRAFACVRLRVSLCERVCVLPALRADEEEESWSVCSDEAEGLLMASRRR